MTIHSGRSNSVNAEAYLHNTTANNPDYVVLGSENRTASKSLLSKAKNLLYSLSTPFRALIRTELHRRVGQREENSSLVDLTPGFHFLRRAALPYQRTYLVGYISLQKNIVVI